ncbi:hypothetical protein [Novosphingobium sp. KN65.2]|uniref:hypothetical protein n=1 Tax=Novosphingobium sp. KN65.2 TaxID=1478134 RepID=UPI0005E59D61|nr:hypothetical protein [Novosphingobium sp. KN65.2]CDO34068.1 hypothetical protein SPHV1_100102 [Novosphingobium sp. KN65.2]
MGFETIENCKPNASQDSVPADGIRIKARVLARRNGGEPTRYIQISVGTGLAKKLALNGEETKVTLAFGTGPDSGKIRLAVDISQGSFPARRDKKGRYAITLNGPSCDGLFSLDFPTFTIPEIEPIYTTGKPPAIIFKASDEMLELAD